MASLKEDVMPRPIPNLWFDTQGLEAAELYVSLFPNSRINHVSRYSEGGKGEVDKVMTVSFELDGQPVVIINGGPLYPQSEAFSFLIQCADQAEVDRYWDALTADGGEEGQCGWLKDRFGVSWQVVPDGFGELMMGSDPERGQRVQQAMFAMKKLDLAALRAAADGQ
jgi:predicted 3-demethylubiquinone-9 3-methyltransferase (glyoxalase superfamily)